jgi:ribosomal protein L31E
MRFIALYCCSCFKKRAPRAVKAIKAFVAKEMKTADVRIDASLNKFVWHKGIRNVPFRVRVRMERKRNEDEEAKELVSDTPAELAHNSIPCDGLLIYQYFADVHSCQAC